MLRTKQYQAGGSLVSKQVQEKKSIMLNYIEIMLKRLID